MRLATIALLMNSSFAWGAQYNYKDPKLNDELASIYKAISAPAEFVELHSFPKATILGSTPRRVGQLYFCSDCSTDAVCVSTGTSLGAFSRVSARTTACN